MAVPAQNPCGANLRYGLVLSATRESQSQIALREVDVAEQKWQKSGATSYWIGFSLAQMALAGPRRVTVINGMAMSLPPCPSSNSDGCLYNYETIDTYTVPGLFGKVRHEASDICRDLSVDYDPVSSYPAEIRADTVLKNVTNLGYIWRVVALEVLP
jgi:hypothetical protein